jgi:hypothetical protein
VSQYEFAMVFVHLGLEFPPTLEAFSKAESNRDDRGLRILITDHPNTLIRFNGQIITTTEKSLASGALLKKRGYYSKLASGYWLNTFERIFALRALKYLPSISSLPIIHLESDVLPLFDSTDVDFICRNFPSVAIPRFSETLGIGSFIFSPNTRELFSVLDKLEKLAIQNVEWLENDMQLLGLALNEGIVLELPSHPSDYLKTVFNSMKGDRLLFDGAALGQYLFGQDPFHQSGLRYSGFKNPAYVARTDIDSMKWKVESDTEGSRLVVEVDKIRYKIANLHIHSKETLPPLSLHSERWDRAIQEANGVITRTQESTTEVSPHSKKPNLMVRLQIAKSKGLRVAIFNYLKKRLR